MAISLAASLFVFWYLLDNSQVMKDEARERFYEQYNTQQLLLAKQASKNIEDFFDTLRRNLGIVASLFENGPVTRERGDEVGDSLDRIYGLISDTLIIDLVVFDSEGTVVAISPHDPYTLGRNYAWRGYFRWAKRQPGRTGRMYLSPIILLAGGQNRGDQALIVAQGIYTNRGTFKGVAMFTLNFDKLADKYIKNIRIGKDGYAWLADTSNKAILVDTNGRVGGKKFSEVFEDKWPRLNSLLLSSADGEPGMDWYDYEDPADPSKTVRKLVGYYPVKIEDRLWTLGVCTPVREVDDQLASYMQRSSIFSTTALIAVFSAAVLFVGLLLGWNRALSGAVRERTLELEETANKLKETFGELIVARKIAAVGNMSLGLVHEIRNPLSAIKMNVQMLMKRMSGDPDVGEHFSIVEGEISRLNQLLGDVMTYARPGALKVAKVNARDLVERVLELVSQRMVSSNTEVMLDFEEDLPPFECDPDQIHQVLLNLLLNSLESLEDSALPRIVFINVQEEEGHIIFAIGDNGPGIPSESRGRVFEPFYTEKAKGLGLGLSIVEGIIRRHGGDISLGDREGGGVVFIVKIPIFLRQGDEK